MSKSTTKSPSTSPIGFGGVDFVMRTALERESTGKRRIRPKNVECIDLADESDDPDFSVSDKDSSLNSDNSDSSDDDGSDDDDKDNSDSSSDDSDSDVSVKAKSTLREALKKLEDTDFQPKKRSKKRKKPSVAVKKKGKGKEPLKKASAKSSKAVNKKTSSRSVKLSKKVDKKKKSSNKKTDLKGQNGDNIAKVKTSGRRIFNMTSRLDVQMKENRKEIDSRRMCSVCLGDNSDINHDEIIECDSCGVTVHEGCYGIANDCISIASNASSCSTEPWFCDVCKYGATSVTCELCPNKGGLFKETNVGRWVHVVCALYTPGVYYESSIPSLCNINNSKWGAYQCAACTDERNTRTGVCISCDAGFCKTMLHATCAQAVGLLSDYTIQEDRFVSCKMHTSRDAAKRRAGIYGIIQEQMKIKQEKKHSEFMSPVEKSSQERIHRKLAKIRNKLSSKYPMSIKSGDTIHSAGMTMGPFLNSMDQQHHIPKIQKRPRLLHYYVSASDQHFWKTKHSESDPSNFEDEDQNMRTIVDVKRKWNVQPALNVQFVAYYLDREKRIVDLSHQYGDLETENQELSDNQIGLKNCFETQQENLMEVEIVLQKNIQDLEGLIDAIQMADPTNKNEKLNNHLNEMLEMATARNGSPEVRATARKTTRRSHQMKVLSPSPTGRLTIARCAICDESRSQHLITRCDRCRKNYHLGCLDPPLTRLPRKTKSCGWMCSDCNDPETQPEPEPDVAEDTDAPRSLRGRTKIKKPGKYREEDTTPESVSNGPSTSARRKIGRDSSTDKSTKSPLSSRKSSKEKQVVIKQETFDFIEQNDDSPVLNNLRTKVRKTSRSKPRQNMKLNTLNAIPLDQDNANKDLVTEAAEMSENTITTSSRSVTKKQRNSSKTNSNIPLSSSSNISPTVVTNSFINAVDIVSKANAGRNPPTKKGTKKKGGKNRKAPVEISNEVSAAGVSQDNELAVVTMADTKIAKQKRVKGQKKIRKVSTKKKLLVFPPIIPIDNGDVASTANTNDTNAATVIPMDTALVIAKPKLGRPKGSKTRKKSIDITDFEEPPKTKSKKKKPVLVAPATVIDGLTSDDNLINCSTISTSNIESNSTLNMMASVSSTLLEPKVKFGRPRGSKTKKKSNANEQSSTSKSNDTELSSLITSVSKDETFASNAITADTPITNFASLSVDATQMSPKPKLGRPRGSKTKKPTDGMEQQPKKKSKKKGTSVTTANSMPNGSEVAVTNPADVIIIPIESDSVSVVSDKPKLGRPRGSKTRPKSGEGSEQTSTKKSKKKVLSNISTPTQIEVTRSDISTNANTTSSAMDGVEMKPKAKIGRPLGSKTRKKSLDGTEQKGPPKKKSKKKQPTAEADPLLTSSTISLTLLEVTANSSQLMNTSNIPESAAISETVKPKIGRPKGSKTMKKSVGDAQKFPSPKSKKKQKSVLVSPVSMSVTQSNVSIPQFIANSPTTANINVTPVLTEAMQPKAKLGRPKGSKTKKKSIDGADQPPSKKSKKKLISSAVDGLVPNGDFSIGTLGTNSSELNLPPSTELKVKTKLGRPKGSKTKKISVDGTDQTSRSKKASKQKFSPIAVSTPMVGKLQMMNPNDGFTSNDSFQLQAYSDLAKSSLDMEAKTFQGDIIFTDQKKKPSPFIAQKTTIAMNLCELNESMFSTPPVVQGAVVVALKSKKIGKRKVGGTQPKPKKTKSSKKKIDFSDTPSLNENDLVGVSPLSSPGKSKKRKLVADQSDVLSPSKRPKKTKPSSFSLENVDIPVVGELGGSSQGLKPKAVRKKKVNQGGSGTPSTSISFSSSPDSQVKGKKGRKQREVGASQQEPKAKRVRKKKEVSTDLDSSIVSHDLSYDEGKPKKGRKSNKDSELNGMQGKPKRIRKKKDNTQQAIPDSSLNSENKIDKTSKTKRKPLNESIDGTSKLPLPPKKRRRSSSAQPPQNPGVISEQYQNANYGVGYGEPGQGSVQFNYSNPGVSALTTNEQFQYVPQYALQAGFQQAPIGSVFQHYPPNPYGGIVGNHTISLNSVPGNVIPDSNLEPLKNSFVTTHSGFAAAPEPHSSTVTVALGNPGSIQLHYQSPVTTPAPEFAMPHYPPPKPASCFTCGKEDYFNNMSLCDRCNRQFHSKCLNPPLLYSPKRRGYSWYCGDCDRQEADPSSNDPKRSRDIGSNGLPMI